MRRKSARKDSILMEDIECSSEDKVINPTRASSIQTDIYAYQSAGTMLRSITAED